MSGRRARTGACLGLLLAVTLATGGTAQGMSPIAVPDGIPAPLRSLIAARMHASTAHRSVWVSRFDVQTKGGYDLAVIGLRGVVAVEVSKVRPKGAGRKARRGAITTYVAHGTATTNRIAASFGRFGEISVRFRPSGRIVKSRRGRHCQGADRYTTRPGVFVGRIHFTGEDRYVQVRAKRAKGRIRRPLRLRCASLPPPTAKSSQAVKGSALATPGVLEAGWREPLAARELIALRLGARILCFASTEESLGSMAEVRYAFAIGPAGSFTENEALTAAKLKPPWPFAGTGRYAASPDGTRTWTGSLRAALPGAPGLPLTGPEFRVRLDSGF
ncbi:MAG TPA: hypothetical protein VF245_05495 [Solirubrobacterales bacterium]